MQAAQYVRAGLDHVRSMRMAYSPASCASRERTTATVHSFIPAGLVIINANAIDRQQVRSTTPGRRGLLRQSIPCMHGASSRRSTTRRHGAARPTRWSSPSSTPASHRRPVLETRREKHGFYSSIISYPRSIDRTRASVCLVLVLMRLTLAGRV